MRDRDTEPALSPPDEAPWASVSPSRTGLDGSRAFTTFATAVARASGRPITFVAAVLTVVAWAACGHWAGYSDTWQLVINTGTTVVTFLMVFLIQHTQNRDAAAIHAKLDELVRSGAALDRYIGIEALTDDELDELRASCRDRAELARGPVA